MARPIPDLELMEANEAALDDRVIIDDTSDAETKAMEIEQLLKLIIPTGLITPFGGASAPDGFLLCDGAAVSRTTYADLFAVVGTNYGVGDGSSTFNLPNLKGRVPVGLDTGQTEFNTLGKSGGNKSHSHGAGSYGANAQIFWQPNTFYIDFEATTTPAHTETRRVSVNDVGADIGLSESGTSAIKVGGTSADGSSLQPFLTTEYIIKA